MFSVNARFREVLKDSGYSQEKFAKEIKRSRGEVANIVYDKVTPRNEIIDAVCERFRINPAWLRSGVGKKEADMTVKQELMLMFGDVLATAPDKRSAIIAALLSQPPETWELIADLAEDIVAKLPKNKKEG